MCSVYYRVNGEMCAWSNSQRLNTVQSNGEEPLCDAVKWSSSKNDGQDFLRRLWECHPLVIPLASALP